MNIEIQLWPPPPSGMTTGALPEGIKAINMDTGDSVCVDIYRYMHQNKAEAIRQLKEKAYVDTQR